MSYKNKIANLFFIFCFFYGVFGSCFSFPGINYFDELITLFLFLLFLIKSISLKKFFEKKIDFLYLLFFLILTIIVIIPTILYRFQDNLIVEIKDILLFSKFFICFYSFKYVFQNFDFSKSITLIKKISKLTIITFLFFGFLSLFIDLNMGSSYRFGIRCYQFLFPHYTFLVYSTCLCLSCIFISFQRKEIKYIILGFIVMALTLRTKAILIIIMITFLMLIGIMKIKLNLKIILVPIIMIFMTTVKKIYTYISWGTYNLRVGLHIASLKIANDFFPFGTGLGTFGSNISREYMSPIYEKYGLIGIQGFNSETADIPVSDVFWPYIIGQWGYLGLFIYIILLLIILIDFLIQSKEKNYGNILSFNTIFIYFIVASFAEAIFTNSSGVSGAIFLGFYYITLENDKNLFDFSFLNNIVERLKKIFDK